MKAHHLAAVLVVGALGLTGCSDNKATESEPTTSAAATTSEAAVVAQMPTAEELNAVLQRAADPALPIEEREQTVQGGEQAPELFDLMTQSQQESGANFQVVNPVLPGYTANSVLATVNFTRPDAESQLAEDVEFVYEDGKWKVSQSWACFLVSNTVAPEQIPAMCQSGAPAPAAPEAPAQVEAPVEEQVQQAPAL